jgi:molybdate transport system ATP-binding protein
MLRVDARKQLGEMRLDIAFATASEVTALFGPSGSGKTSILNMVCGLLRPDSGSIVLGDEMLFDSDRRVDVPAHRRGIGYVFQERRLFPHLTVRQNLAFGRWMRGVAADAAHERHVVEMLGIGHLLRRRPTNLSGGEQQRVAIGRALLLRPRLLLLDEPLAGLDRARAAEVLPYLERLRGEGVPMLYVSHDPHEVARMADTVVVIGEGRVERTVAGTAPSDPGAGVSVATCEQTQGARGP